MSLSSGFFVSNCLCLSACAATQRTVKSIAFKTTGVEDTYLILAANSFQVGVNNSYIFLPVQTYEKKNCQVSVLVEYKIP